jgi:hypothetical protein
MNEEKIVKLGDVVFYNTTKEEREVMGFHSNCNVAFLLPAIVVAVLSQTCLNIKVFCDGDLDIWKTSVLKGDNEMNWNFLLIEEPELKEANPIEKVEELVIPEILTEEHSSEEFQFTFVAIVDKQIVKPVISASSKEEAYLKFEEKNPFCTVIRCNLVE